MILVVELVGKREKYVYLVHFIPLNTYEDLDLIFYYSVCKCFSFPSHYYVLLPPKPNFVFGDKNTCFKSFTRRTIRSATY